MLVRSLPRALSTYVLSPRAYPGPVSPTGILRTRGLHTVPTRGPANAMDLVRSIPGRGRRSITSWGSSSASALRATSSSSKTSLTFAPAMASCARGGVVPPTPRCATAWGSRQWTRCATIFCLSASCRMRARAHPTSTSTSKPADEKRSSSTCTTRLGGIVRLRLRTSSRIARALRSATLHGLWATPQVRPRPGLRAGERPPNL